LREQWWRRVGAAVRNHYQQMAEAVIAAYQQDQQAQLDAMQRLLDAARNTMPQTTTLNPDGAKGGDYAVTDRAMEDLWAAVEAVDALDASQSCGEAGDGNQRG
jgi:hypothetical protein